MSKKIVHSFINKPDDYIFNILEIDNFNKETSSLRNFYKHIIKYDKMTYKYCFTTKAKNF